MQPTSPAPSRMRLLIVFVLLVAVTVCGQWWFGRPKRAAERFIRLLGSRQPDEAATMLVDSSMLHFAEGELLVRAVDGTSVTLAKDELPLVALKTDDFRSRDTLSDYTSGRYRFQVATSGPAVQHGAKNLVHISCIAESDRISIATIHKPAEEIP